VAAAVSITADVADMHFSIPTVVLPLIVVDLVDVDGLHVEDNQVAAITRAVAVAPTILTLQHATVAET